MATADAGTYVGTELDVFAGAVNWKRYLHTRIAPYMGRNVLEVGAGIGGTTKHLCQGDFGTWTCLEPDPALLDRLSVAIEARELPACCRPLCGILRDVVLTPEPDTILYIDVLEHIEDDRAELSLALDRVRPGGFVVVLSPAHPWLYTNFDRAIGHYRRYTKASIAELTPAGAVLEKLEYLDSAGLAASAGNRWLLQSASPTAAQVGFWDRVLVPLSRWSDPVVGHRIGKSVLAVWRRTTLEDSIENSADG